LIFLEKLINIILNIYLFDKFIRGKRQHSSGEYMEIILFAFIAALIISLIIVIKSADLFVDNLVEIGLALGISEIILGVTASAVGTSLPEFGSAMIAILTGSPEMGISVAIGANIWNIAGILGITTVVAGIITTNKEEVNRDGLMALLTAVIITVFMYLFGELSSIVGIILSVIYVVYLWILIKAQKKSNDQELSQPKENKRKINKKSIFWLLIGLVGLAIGCRAIVYSTVEIAEILSIPEALAGILLAFGTTTPEFFTVLTSARKGLNSLALGTVLGSNVFNILIGLGVPAIFVTVPVEQTTIMFDAPAMIIITVLLLILIRRGMKLERVEGIILVASYILFIGLRLLYGGI